MTLDELKEALEEIIPTASYHTNDKGEVVIFTGLTEEEDGGELIEFDEVDDDFDFSADRGDDELESYDESDEDEDD